MSRTNQPSSYIIASFVIALSFIACNIFALDKLIDMNMFVMTFNTANQHKDLCGPYIYFFGACSYQVRIHDSSSTCNLNIVF